MKTVNFFHSGGIFKNNLKFRIFWENSDKHGAKRHNQLLSEVILFFIFLAICGCLNVSDGPFNKNGKMVPSLLYAKNDTNYVTFWDEDLKTYRTYDQDKSYFLTDPLLEFEVEEELGKGLKIVERPLYILHNWVRPEYRFKEKKAVLLVTSNEIKTNPPNSLSKRCSLKWALFCLNPAT